MSAISAFIVLAFVVTSVKCGAFGQNCSTTFQAVGCYRDFRHRRTLPRLLLNERGTKGFWQKYKTVLPSLVCNCANKAKVLGLPFFAIQFYGECWVGKTFPFPQKRTSCVDTGFKPCAETGSERICSGKHWTNFVYSEVENPTAVATTAKPSTRKPTTAKPTIAKPTTARPTTAKPTTAKPTTAKPTTTKPTTAKPTTAKPTTVKPTTAKPTTAKPTKPPITIKCKVPLDIAFVVDASGSVGIHSFQLVKRFLIEFTQYFNVSANGSHFACLHYDHRVFKDFTFNDTEFYDPLALERKIGKIPYPSGATVTHKALEVAETFFWTHNGARDYHNIPRCLLVFTDGRTYRGKEQLILPVRSLKFLTHVKIVAVGITWQAAMDELILMAGDNHYVLVNTFEGLSDAMQEVLDKVCT